MMSSKFRSMVYPERGMASDALHAMISGESGLSLKILSFDVFEVDGGWCAEAVVESATDEDERRDEPAAAAEKHDHEDMPPPDEWDDRDLAEIYGAFEDELEHTLAANLMQEFGMAEYPVMAPSGAAAEEPWMGPEDVLALTDGYGYESAPEMKPEPA